VLLRIQQITGGALQISMARYPALYRLERCRDDADAVAAEPERARQEGEVRPAAAMARAKARTARAKRSRKSAR
jgi:hypothetical protein